MLRLDPDRMRIGVRIGCPKLTPTNERTNVLTERIPTSSYQASVLNARARMPKAVWSGVLVEAKQVRQDERRPTLTDSITAECLPTDERTAR